MVNAGSTMFGLVGLLAVVLVACSNQSGDTAQAPLQTVVSETRGNISQVDRIAYVSPNGDLFTVDPDGGGLSQLTGGLQAGQGPEGSSQAQPLRLNEFYAWPTWSADGTKLAASRVVAGDGRTKITLEVLDARTGRSESVYENGQQAGLVAEGAPHFIYWAPTGNALSFLASTSDGLGLFVWDGTSGKPASLVDQGAPLYYHWYSDTDTMALHIGPDVSLANPLAGSAPQPVVQSAAGFRVPAISPDGRSLAYAAAVGEDMGLYVTPINDLGQARKIIDIGVNSAFLWSPDGNILLVGDQSNPRVPFYNRLMLVPLDGGPVTTLTTDGVLAFYWAPTGEKIAWVEVNPEQQEMEWVVSPSDGSNAKRLFAFRPSGEVFIMLSFFDQYAYSHSPWSPDGKSLVVAGSKGEVARRSNGLTPTGDRIYVLDADGDAAPRDLGAGVLAFWSWN